MDMQEARNTLVSAVMNNAGSLQRAAKLLDETDPAVASAIKEILQASEAYVFSRVSVKS